MALNTSIWRASPQYKDSYVYIHNGTTVYGASVNQGTFQYPVSQLIYDGASGSLANTRIGQTVQINDSSGNFKGYARVRDTVAGSVLYIGETSEGEISFADNDQIRILDEFRLWSKTPRILPDGNTYKDYDLGFTAQRQLGPIANAGPYLARWVAGGSIQVDFNGTSSFAFNGTNTYSWNFRDGTPSTSTSAIVNNVQFPPGARYVSLTVTDGNGETHTAYSLIAALDGTILSPFRAQLTRYSQQLNEGTNIELDLQDANVDSTVFRNGAPVIYFENEYYNGTPGSLTGYTDRESVKFVGFHTDTRVGVQPFFSNVAISAQGPLSILKSLPAYPQVLERVTTPASWQEMNGLNWFRAMIYYGKWHSTAFEQFDVYQPSHYADYPVMRLEAPAGALYDQLQDITRAVGGNFTADRTGAFFSRLWPHLANNTYRNALNEIVALADTDWAETVDIPQLVRDSVGWLKASAIVASTSEILAVLSASPGNAPSQGLSQESFDRQLVTTQAELNQRTGDMYAYRNRKIPTVGLTILNQGGVVDPALQEWVGFELDAASNRRGLEFDTDARFTVSTVDISFDNTNGTSLERWVLEPEQDGVDGITVPIPDIDNGDTITDTPPEDYYPPPNLDNDTPVTPIDVPDPPNGEAIAWGGRNIWVTFSRLSPTWDIAPDYAIFTATLNHEVLDVIADPRSPRLTNGIGPLALWALTNNGGSGSRLYYASDALSGTFTLQQTFSHAYKLLRAVRGVPNAVAGYGAPLTTPDTQVFYTDDNGATVTETSLGVASSDPIVNRAGFDTDDFNIGVILCGLNTNLYFTTSYTGAFTVVSTALWNGGVGSRWNQCRIPYRVLDGSGALNNNPNALHFIMWLSEQDASGDTVKRGVLNTSLGTCTLTDITPVISASTYTIGEPNGLESLASNPLVMLAKGHIDGSFGVSNRIMLTTNAGTSWSIPNNTLNLASYIRWSNIGSNAAWLTNGITQLGDTIDYTPDRASTFSDRRGNLVGHPKINGAFPLD